MSSISKDIDSTHKGIELSMGLPFAVLLLIVDTKKCMLSHRLVEEIKVCVGGCQGLAKANSIHKTPHICTHNQVQTQIDLHMCLIPDLSACA